MLSPSHTDSSKWMCRRMEVVVSEGKLMKLSSQPRIIIIEGLFCGGRGRMGFSHEFEIYAWAWLAQNLSWQICQLGAKKMKSGNKEKEARLDLRGDPKNRKQMINYWGIFVNLVTLIPLGQIITSVLFLSTQHTWEIWAIIKRSYKLYIRFDELCSVFYK